MNAVRSWLRIIPVLVILLAGAACRSGPAPVDLQMTSSTATVTRGPMAEVVQLGGQVVMPSAQVLTAGSLGGRVLEVAVHAGQKVQEGQVLARLDTTGRERRLREAEADLRVAEAMLAEAQRSATTAEVAQAAADLAAAEAELAAARLKLTLAQRAGLRPLEEAAADSEAALQRARDRLQQAELSGSESTISALEYDQAFYQRALRDLKPGADGAEEHKALAAVERQLANARAGREATLRQASEEVTKAQEQLAKDQAALARAKAGQEDPALSARLEVEKAAAKVERAQSELAEFQAGTDSAAVRAAKTTYEAALAEVEGARAAIAEATLTAPFDAVVFAVYWQPDQEVQPGAEAVLLADPQELHIAGQATEMDITRLSLGQEVRVTFDAYPGRLFSGELSMLPARGHGEGGMSYFALEATVEPEDAHLFPGMSANLRVVVGQVQDVLLVPSAAIRYRPPDETYVTVLVAEGQTQERKVKIGMNDGIMAEVQEGLEEGLTVVVPLAPPMEPRRGGFYGGYY